MYVYTLIFLVFAILAIEYEIKPIPRTNFILILIAIFLSLFAGLRGEEVSRDYIPYLGSFKSVLNGDTSAGILPLFEPGFVYIVLFCYKFFENNASIAVMLIFAIFSTSMKIYGIKKLSINPFLVVLLYFCNFYLFQEMTQIRNGMACSFFILAIIYYLKDQKLNTALFIVLAILFHVSAVIYFLIFLLKKDALNKYVYTGLLVGSIVLGLVVIPLSSFLEGLDINIVSNKLTTYVEFAESGFFSETRFANKLTIFKLIITAYFLYYHIRYKVTDPYFTIFLKLNIISIFMYGLMIGVPSMAARLSELFGISVTFLFAYGVQTFPFKKLNIVVVIGIAIVYFYTILFHDKLLMPYSIIHFR